MTLSTLDVAVVATSVIGVVGFGVRTALVEKRRESSASDEYFLAGRSMPWFVVAASLFAANVGSEQFIGMAGTAAESGIAVAIYELSAPFMLILLGWVFTPLYLHCNLHTTPEYLEKRFSRVIRLLFVCVLILTHVMATISGTLYAGTVVMEVLTGMTIWESAPLIVLLTAFYTIAGGLRAVMLTDSVQSVILLTGGLVGSVTALNLVGGIDGLFRMLEEAKLTEFPHLMRPLDDRDFPWLGTWLALVIGGVRYWCLDQEMAQRALSARNLHHARLGTAGAALLKLLPLFIISAHPVCDSHNVKGVCCGLVLPGMVARLLFELCKANPEGQDFPEWCEAQMDDAHHSNKAYPLLVLLEFPSGVKGLMIASFLAAMMSSLASLFNSVSAMFTYDIYARFLTRRERLSPSHLVTVGRCAVVGLVVLAFLWIPVIDTADRGLFIVAVEILSHLGPPITAVFVCGILLRRVNEQGALIGLLLGSLLGGIRLMLFLIFQDTCDRHVHGKHQNLSTTNWFACLNFHYFSVLLFTLTVIVVVCSSLAYPPPSTAQTEGRVFTLSMLAETSFSKAGYSSLPSDNGSDTKHRDKQSPTAEEATGDPALEPPIAGPPLSSRWSILSSIFLPVLVIGTTTGVIYYFR